MAFTVFDIFMARSLRSLAGFCMGEYQKKSYNYYQVTKKNSLSSTPQYCSIQSISARNTRYLLYLQYFLYLGKLQYL